MNRNVFEALNATPDGGAPKNAFDLHNFEWMTSKAGQLLPVGCREVVPDGTYDLSVDAYTMTFPCNTASQADMKENYYFLFVPYYLLTRTAYSFFPQRKDNHSALDYQIEQMPWFKLGDVVSRCVYVCFLNRLYNNHGVPASVNEADIHGYSIYEGALRLLDLLGYGCYLDLVDKAYKIYQESGDSARGAFIQSIKNNLNNYKPNVLRIAAYQKAWYCYFRNSVYDNQISPKSFNFDDVTYPSDTTYNVLDYRQLDDFIRDCLQIRYVQNKKDFVNASMPGTQFGAVSTVPVNLDLSDLQGSFVGTPVTPVYHGSDINLDTNTARTGTDLSRHYYSFFDGQYLNDEQYATFMNDGTGGTFIADERMSEGGSHSYDKSQIVRTYKPVGIQAQQVNTQGLAGDRTVQDEHVYNAHTHSLFGTLRNYGSIDPITPAGTISFSGGSGSQASLFDVLQLTEAQAIQKWRQKSMLAGQKAKDQWRAHYGVIPEHLKDDYPDFIGSVDNIIHISQVVSQANTLADDSKSNLGDIAGRGYGASDTKKFRFHAKEYGVVILLRSIVAENVYSSYGIDRANQLIYYTDFWQPEFQNIGLEAVPKSLIQGFKPSNESQPSGEGGDSPLPVTSSIIGYAPRNYQLKQYVSKVHGLFNPNRFTGFTQPFNPLAPFGFGELEAFVQVRRDVVQKLVWYNNSSIVPGNVPISLSTLYVNPAITNSTFAFDADGYEDTDTFIHKVRFNCDAVQPLSTLGLPQF